MSDTILSRSGTGFIPAPRELSGDEIVSRYGTLITDSLSAFREDPNYFVAMAENASLITYKRSLWELRMEATRNLEAAAGGVAVAPEHIKTETARLMDERGLTAPSRAPRQRRSRASA